MDWAELGQWFVVAGITAFCIVRYSQRKVASARAEDIEGILHQRFATNIARADLRACIEQSMLAAGLSLHSGNEERLVYDSKTIGLFHWGFLYIIDLPSREPGTVVVSIFGKGPNPPGEKAMQKQLDAFLGKLQGVLMTPQGAAS